MISKDELISSLDRVDITNGLFNRYLWCCSRGSKELPEGGKLLEISQERAWIQLQGDFNRITPRGALQITRNEEAADIWGRDDKPGIGVYATLNRERYGMAGKVLERAPAQVLRLSLLYAVLDGAKEIRREHLDAALEVWRYCEDSVLYIFGAAADGSTADGILKALRSAPAGLTRTDLRDLFGRHKKEQEITEACLLLLKAGTARYEKVQGARGGPPRERWFATRV